MGREVGATGVQDGPLFYTTGKKALAPVSTDNWRKQWSQKAAADRTVGTHSLRKGGAKWYRSSGKCPVDAVQVQGGWAHRETMQKIYARETKDALRRQLHLAANAAAQGHH